MDRHTSRNTQETTPCTTDEWRLEPVMPVLRELRSSAGPIRGDVALVVGLQHLFGSTLSLIRQIAGERVRPTNVLMLGKPYSANREVVDRMRGLGYQVCSASRRQAIDRPHDDQSDARIEQMLSLARARLELLPPEARALLIDDGGRAIRMLHEERWSDIRRRFTCVEQTRAGIRALEGVELEVPVINVAESWVKLRHESPMIAESVQTELLRKLQAMRSRGIPVGTRALVVGYGAIGRAVAAELSRNGFDVAIHDSEPERARAARRDGRPTYRSLHRAIRRGGLIVGCTGRTIIDRSGYGAIPAGAILVSASSADVEFQGWELRPTAISMGRPECWQRGNEVAEQELHHPCFSLYRCPGSHGSFYLVNGGFPVNFTGGVDPIPAEKIQLTRSLLYLGAVAASRSTRAGLHDLDDGAQRRLMKMLAEQDGSLSAA